MKGPVRIKAFSTLRNYPCLIMPEMRARDPLLKKIVLRLPGKMKIEGDCDGFNQVETYEVEDGDVQAFLQKLCWS
jgi:hypothetical protein